MKEEMFERFCAAFMAFLNVKSVSFDIFMKKLAICLENMRQCISYPAYLELFRTIYNYRNQSPVSTESVKEVM